MRMLGRKTSSRSRKRKRRSYSSNVPRYSVNVHVSTGSTTQHTKKR